VNDSTVGFTGLGALINISSLSTLRRLHFEFSIDNENQDPLCGLYEEFCALTGPNMIEEISLEAYVNVDVQCKVGDEWGRLDAVLTNGFPKLCQVSLRIVLAASSSYANGIALEKKLNKLPEEQFPRLSENTTVMFDFSTRVDFIRIYTN